MATNPLLPDVAPSGYDVSIDGHRFKRGVCPKCHTYWPCAYAIEAVTFALGSLGTCGHSSCPRDTSRHADEAKDLLDVMTEGIE